MRIISETKSENFLIEVDATEMANLLGTSYFNEVKDVVRENIKKGFNIDVSQIYKNYEDVSRLVSVYDRSIDKTLVNLNFIVETLKNLKPKAEKIKKEFEK